MAGGTRRWDMSQAMASNPDKKAAAEKRAVAIYRGLMALPRPSDIASNNAWTEKAGVSSSFFTNMQGIAKAASEPSIGNLRAVLEAAGSSLPEFFLHEAQGRVVRRPSEQEIALAIAEAWDELPKKQSERPGYLAKAVRDILALPPSLPATRASEDRLSEDGPEEAAPRRSATKRS